MDIIFASEELHVQGLIGYADWYCYICFMRPEIHVCCVSLLELNWRHDSVPL
uniref:Uncharacterized protein n=1 Tax=Romanomermis culicivorax TaxID=13658 RepID=A0A915IA87_ROMCU